MIVFNLWGALFILLAFCVGAVLPHSPDRPLGIIAAGVVGILFDLALRAHKSGRWKGTGFRNVAGDLFDPGCGGMLMVLPIWLWGIAAITLGVLHYTRVL